MQLSNSEGEADQRQQVKGLVMTSTPSILCSSFAWKSSDSMSTITSLRETAYLYSGLSPCLLTCDWAQVNGGEWARREEGRKRERVYEREGKDESNALQQSPVTDQAFISAETAAVAGRTQQQQLQHRSITQCLHHSWRQGGHEEGDRHREHNTSPLSPAIWFLEYYASSLPRSTSIPLSSSHSSVHLLLIPQSWFEGVFMPRERKHGLNKNQRSLYRSDIKY